MNKELKSYTSEKLLSELSLLQKKVSEKPKLDKKLKSLQELEGLANNLVNKDLKDYLINNLQLEIGLTNKKIKQIDDYKKEVERLEQLNKLL